MVSRRQFLQMSAMAAAALAVPYRFLSSPTTAQAFSQSGNLKKFVQTMRGVGDIPVAAADKTPPSWTQPGATHYTIDIGQYEDTLHPDMPSTTLRGFGQGGVFKHLGGIIAAKRGEAVQITFRNTLPPDYILPFDPTIMDATSHQSNAACIHLHGGLVPWTSDGGPYAWFDPDGHRGPSFVDPLNPNRPRQTPTIFRSQAARRATPHRVRRGLSAWDRMTCRRSRPAAPWSNRRGSHRPPGAK